MAEVQEQAAAQKLKSETDTAAAAANQAALQEHLVQLESKISAAAPQLAEVCCHTTLLGNLGMNGILDCLDVLPKVPSPVTPPLPSRALQSS